jgi:hypothetical protein
MTLAYRCAQAAVLTIFFILLSPDAAEAQSKSEQENSRDVRICVLQDDALTIVTARYNVVTGDTTIGGSLFNRVHPAGPEYAADTEWFREHRSITVAGTSYQKYGLPRVLGVDEVESFAAYEGVLVFAEPGDTDAPEMIWLPVRPGCEFQPYQREVD